MVLLYIQTNPLNIFSLKQIIGQFPGTNPMANDQQIHRKQQSTIQEVASSNSKRRKTKLGGNGNTLTLL